MEFINPGFLYGLFALAIPVIIHLFNFRRFRKVYFTNVKFIEELKQETQKQSRLRHLLILLMRMLAIAALVLAFAQPFIPVDQVKKDVNSGSTVSVYVDNSFSMQAESGKGTMLDEAKEKALEVASAYKGSDLFQLLTNDFEGRHQRVVSRDEFINMVEDVMISPVVRTFGEVLARQEEVFSDNAIGEKASYFISDFQKSSLGKLKASMDSNLLQYIVPLQAVNANNLYIDSCWFLSPVQQIGQHVKLKVRVKNSSDIDYEKIPVKLEVNGIQKALASLDIAHNSSTEVELPFRSNESGIQEAVVSISDFPIGFDDKFYFSWYVAPLVKVLCINQNKENIFIDAVLGNDSAFLFQNVPVSQIDYSSFPQYQFIVLNELKSVSSGLEAEIINFVEDGGNILVLPAEKPDFENYKSFLTSMHCNYYISGDTSKTKISYINLEHPLYDDVFDEIPENIDLPVVFNRFVISGQTRSRQEVLLRLQDGNAFLSVQYVGTGKVYLSAVPFDPGFSNFPHHAIFVPTIYKMAVSSAMTNELYYMIGEKEMISIRHAGLQGDDILRIRQVSSGFEFIPGQLRVNGHVDLNMHGQILYAGNYLLERGENTLKALSFNYNRNESEMVFYSADELKEMAESGEMKGVHVLDAGTKFFSKTVRELNQGKRLWRWFVVFALVFLAIEILLLRRRG
jgi:hypothetical protein